MGKEGLDIPLDNPWTASNLCLTEGMLHILMLKMILVALEL
jgi:hypothetical protein